MGRLVTARTIRAAILAQRPDEPVWCEQTGGGTATIYVGHPLDAPPHRYPVAIGPGSYDWGDAWASIFELSETAVGPDDDGLATPVYPTTVRGIVVAALTRGGQS